MGRTRGLDSDRSADQTTAEPATGRRSVLRAGTGLATLVTGVATLAGRAAAHFPTGLEIEVRPGNGASSINPRSKGLVPVVVFRTDEFDPTAADVRYRFGAPDTVRDGGGARPANDGLVADIDGDGRADLVLQFRMDETGFDGSETDARMEWERTPTGEHGRSGTDSITIVGRSDRD